MKSFSFEGADHLGSALLRILWICNEVLGDTAPWSLGWAHWSFHQKPLIEVVCFEVILFREIFVAMILIDCSTTLWSLRLKFRNQLSASPLCECHLGAMRMVYANTLLFRSHCFSCACNRPWSVSVSGYQLNASNTNESSAYESEDTLNVEKIETNY